MTVLVVEDGTGVAGANGYVTMEEANDYASARGLTFAASPSTTGEQAIIRATASLDAIYRARFSGYKTNGRDQNLEWPRTGAWDAEGNAIATDEIPAEIKNACIEMAVRELADPGSMTPDLERGGEIRSMQAGSVRIDYGAAASATTTFQTIDGILAGLLGPVRSAYSAVASRG